VELFVDDPAVFFSFLLLSSKKLFDFSTELDCLCQVFVIRFGVLLLAPCFDLLPLLAAGGLICGCGCDRGCENGG